MLRKSILYTVIWISIFPYTKITICISKRIILITTISIIYPTCNKITSKYCNRFNYTSTCFIYYASCWSIDFHYSIFKFSQSFICIKKTFSTILKRFSSQTKSRCINTYCCIYIWFFWRINRSWSKWRQLTYIHSHWYISMLYFWYQWIKCCWYWDWGICLLL